MFGQDGVDPLGSPEDQPTRGPAPAKVTLLLGVDEGQVPPRGTRGALDLSADGRGLLPDPRGDWELVGCARVDRSDGAATSIEARRLP